MKICELRHSISRFAFIFALGGLVVACESIPTASQDSSGEAGGPSGSGTTVQNVPPASLRQFTDIPVPVNAVLNKDATMVFGSGDQWIGRLVFSTGTDSFDLFQQYRQKFPQFGWEEVTSLRSKVSIITYTRGSRVATVQIEPSTLFGSRVEISMSPRGNGGTKATVPSAATGGQRGVNADPGRSPYQSVQ